MQDLKSHAEQAIATALTLQERHRETTCKLIHAKAELQILHLDKKQVQSLCQVLNGADDKVSMHDAQHC